MKGFRTTAGMALAIGLLVGSGMATTAQEEEPSEHPTPAWVTGTVGQGGAVVQEPTETPIDGGMQVRGMGFAGEPLEIDDPRLSGTLSRVFNTDTYDIATGEFVALQTFTFSVENDAGSWSGQGTALVHGGETIPREDATDMDTVFLLTGADAYEGLSAYLIIDWTADPIEVEGAIVQGEMPPFP
jgi:hypothetical protein